MSEQQQIDRAWWVELRGWLDVAKDSDNLAELDRARLDKVCAFVDGILHAMPEPAAAAEPDIVMRMYSTLQIAKTKQAGRPDHWRVSLAAWKEIDAGPLAVEKLWGLPVRIDPIQSTPYFLVFAEDRLARFRIHE